jgi:hypothetical protein
MCPKCRRLSTTSPASDPTRPAAQASKLTTTQLSTIANCVPHSLRKNEHYQPPSAIHTRLCRASRVRRRPRSRRRSRRKRPPRLLRLQLLHARDAVCAVRHDLARPAHAYLQDAQPRQQPPAMHRPRYQDDSAGPAARALRAAR